MRNSFIVLLIYSLAALAMADEIVMSPNHDFLHGVHGIGRI